MHCKAILKARYQSGTLSLNKHIESYFSKHRPEIDEALEGSLIVIKREVGTCGINYGSFD